jgi:hypothetical protein
MITLSEVRQKPRTAASFGTKRETVMKKRWTYRLLIQSEERNKNVMEIAVYVLVALSCLMSIWQFAEQPNALPMDNIKTVGEQQVQTRIAS